MKILSLILVVCILFGLTGINLFAETADNLYASIISTYKSSDYNECINLSKKFVKNYKDNEKRPNVLMILGIAFAKTGDNNKAIKILKYHDKKYPDFNENDKVELLLGKLYYMTKDYNNTERVLNKLIEKHKDSKYIPMAETILAKIRSENMSPKIPEKTAVSKEASSEFSWKKITWAKVGAGLCLISAPIFYLLGNSSQNTADSVYNNEYMNATTSEDAVKYYNEVTDNDKTAALYKNLALGTFIIGSGLFALDYFSVGRVYAGTTSSGSLKIEYSKGF